MFADVRRVAAKAICVSRERCPCSPPWEGKCCHFSIASTILHHPWPPFADTTVASASAERRRFHAVAPPIANLVPSRRIVFDQPSFVPQGTNPRRTLRRYELPATLRRALVVRLFALTTRNPSHCRFSLIAWAGCCPDWVATRYPICPPHSCPIRTANENTYSAGPAFFQNARKGRRRLARGSAPVIPKKPFFFFSIFFFFSCQNSIGAGRGQLRRGGEDCPRSPILLRQP